MSDLIKKIKLKNEDFEFYPTTDEIIQTIINDISNELDKYSRFYRNKFSSFMDIGAGNGKVLKVFKNKFNVDVYAIEKSQTLRNLLDQSVYIIGTDFYQQSLIDKSIDVTFSNPPYSDFIRWTIKIIKESCSNFVYLVLPIRWKNSKEILDVLKYREAEFKILGEFSFENSKERAARTIVNLIRIELSVDKDDAFDRFFDEEFSELKNKFSNYNEENIIKKKKEKFNTLVLGKDYVKNLLQLYNDDLKYIKNNYDNVSKLDINLMNEFDIDPNKILICLKNRLKGLKNFYWNELISRMTEITEKLITKNRKKLLETLQKNGHVDFTESNIYAVILWILKNSNDYIENQLIEVYEEAINKANCKNYKSNKKIFEYDRWRYNNEKPSHIFLDYRIILQYCGGFDNYSYNGYRLDERACEYLSDLITIANNLGFKSKIDDERLNRWGINKDIWKPGKPQIFNCIYKNISEVLMEVKVYKNRNIHIRLNQKFALALNVEYGRLKGWLHSKEEASEELMESKAYLYFKTNFNLLENNPLYMLEHQKN